MSDKLQIINYRPEHFSRFRQINIDWISKSYVLEDIDKKVLNNPDEYILKDGGSILMAIYGKEIVGTCSLTNEGHGIYELTKMGVDEKYRGLKIGYHLGVAIIEKAKQKNAKKVILYSNTKHSGIAIDLYRKLGFIEVPMDSALWVRADIKMEIKM
jgi:ribosomal protein S18 acetylase RimI-like enzyme